MPPRKKSDAEIFTEEYIDGAVKVHVKASEVPPRDDFHISLSEASKIGDETVSSNQEAYEKSHGKLYDMTHNNTVPWRNWAFYLIILSLLTTCFTFAKYASFATANDSVAVAKFNVVVNATKSIAEDTKITITNPAGKDITDASNTADINIILDDKNVTEKTVRFTVTNSSDVSVIITSVEWQSDPQHTYKFSTAKTAGTNNTPLDSSAFDAIKPGATNNSQYFDLTVYKANSNTDENATLIVTIEQVD